MKSLLFILISFIAITSILSGLLMISIPDGGILNLYTQHQKVNLRFTKLPVRSIQNQGIRSLDARQLQQEWNQGFWIKPYFMNEVLYPSIIARRRYFRFQSGSYFD